MSDLLKALQQLLIANWTWTARPPDEVLDGVIGDGDGATHPVVSGDVADVAIHAWSQLDSDTTRRTPGNLDVRTGFLDKQRVTDQVMVVDEQHVAPLGIVTSEYATSRTSITMSPARRWSSVVLSEAMPEVVAQTATAITAAMAVGVAAAVPAWSQRVCPKLRP